MSDYDPDDDLKTAEIAELRQKVFELESQLVHRHHFSALEIEKFSKDRCAGSGVILSIVCLGGRPKMDPICISGGLSSATIAHLQKDIRTSYIHRTELTPKGLKVTVEDV